MITIPDACRHCGAIEQRHDGDWDTVCPDGFDALKLVYVAGKFSAKTREGVEANIQAAVAVGIEVAKLGAYPVIPHANTAHPDFEAVQPYRFYIVATMQTMRACHALITVPGWEESSGATGEVKDMLSLGRPVFHGLETLKMWLNRGKWDLLAGDEGAA